MNWRSFVVGIGAGVAGAFFVKKSLQRQDLVNPEKVLANVKNQFKKEGPIDGSWIIMKTETFVKEPLHYDVYKGGITRQVNGSKEQYEFVADAKTGAILDVYQLGS